MPDTITVRVLVQIRPDRAEQFVRLMRAAGNRPPAPDGPRTAHLYYDESSDRAVIIEEHDDSIGLLANLRAPDDEDRAALSGTYDVLDMEIYGPASDDVRQLLGEAARFYGPLTSIA
jgi:hypothetical protein